MKIIKGKIIATFLFKWSINRNKEPDKINIKREEPVAPIKGIQPSKYEPPIAVPAINQGKPENQDPRIISNKSHVLGKAIKASEKVLFFKYLNNKA